MGDRAPEFTLSSADGPVGLAELLAEGPLVLYFYPADFTPGCTMEACGIRDMHAEIGAAGLTVVGVSPLDGATQARFAQTFGLPFRLLSDPAKTVIRAYGVDGPFGVGVRRATFLIDVDGVIADLVVDDWLIDRHTRFVRRAAGLAGGG